MGKGISGRRHAQAVFRIALETGQLERWQADLEKMGSVLQDKDLVSFLEHPKVSLERKSDMLQRLLQGIMPTAMNLAHLLVAKKRLRIVPSLVAEYRRLVNAAQGVVEADVITAIPITDQEAERIGKDLAGITGKTVMLGAKVDHEIMGGLVVRLGDKLMDGSVRTRLQELRRRLV
jgi:F-type H+-transporting ATPase subunit delta